MKGQAIDNYLAGLLRLRHENVMEINNVYGAVLVKANTTWKQARVFEEEMMTYGWELTNKEDGNIIWKFDTGPVTR